MRQFAPITTRQGGVATQIRFELRCKCGSVDSISGTKSLPDDQVQKKFSARGWVIGRNRSYDVCPSCVGVQPQNRLAKKFRVSEGGVPVSTPKELAEQVFSKRQIDLAKVDEAIAKLKSGHQNEPEAPAPAIAPTAADSAEIEILRQQVASLSATNASIVEEMKEARAANELLVELMAKFVENQKQQTEAIGRLGAQVARSHDVLGIGFNNLQQSIVGSIGTGFADIGVSIGEAVASVATRSLPPPVETPFMIASPVRGKSVDRGIADLFDRMQVEDAIVDPGVDVNGTISMWSPDSKTRGSIKIDRHIWDQAGFTETDRFDVVFEDGVLTIARSDVGIKVSNLSSLSAILKVSRIRDVMITKTKARVSDGKIVA